jgi:hypothetical protein
LEQSPNSENRIQDVPFDLDSIVLPQTATEADRTLIAETLLKLPREVREKVLVEKVIFVTIPKVAGWIRRLPAQRSPWMIFLNFPAMSDRSKSRRMDLIAHEVAHFVLGHTEGGKSERMADALSEKWGFKPIYRERDYRALERTEHSEFKRQVSSPF